MITLFIFCVILILSINQCHIFGHSFEDNGDVLICKKCGITTRKVKSGKR